MILRLQIAFRNVLRNKRRTLSTAVMIAGAITAVVLFKGFAHNIIRKLQGVAINAQYGHIQVANTKLWNLSAKDSLKQRLSEIPFEIKQKINRLPGVSYSSARLSFYGLINNGESSLSARGVGFDPAIEAMLLANIYILEGRHLGAASKFEILVSKVLATQAGLKVGDMVTVLAQTVDGSVNAVDCELVGLFTSGLAEVDSSTFLVPLTTAQRLLDTDAVERLVVQLDRTEDTPQVRREIAGVIGAEAGLEARDWENLAVFYRQVVDYFEVQNGIIQWILAILALLAVGNVVSMSVAERTGEIGTARALGDSRAQVFTQFIFEGLIIGIFGGALGSALAFVCGKLLTWVHIPVMTPGAAVQLDMEVDLMPHVFAGALASMILSAVLATLYPAWHAARLEVVEALKRNI